MALNGGYVNLDFTSSVWAREFGESFILNTLSCEARIMYVVLAGDGNHFVNRDLVPDAYISRGSVYSLVKGKEPDAPTYIALGLVRLGYLKVVGESPLRVDITGLGFSVLQRTTEMLRKMKSAGEARRLPAELLQGLTGRGIELSLSDIKSHSFDPNHPISHLVLANRQTLVSIARGELDTRSLDQLISWFEVALASRNQTTLLSPEKLDLYPIIHDVAEDDENGKRRTRASGWVTGSFVSRGPKFGVGDAPDADDLIDQVTSEEPEPDFYDRFKVIPDGEQRWTLEVYGEGSNRPDRTYQDLSSEDTYLQMILDSGLMTPENLLSTYDTPLSLVRAPRLLIKRDGFKVEGESLNIASDDILKDLAMNLVRLTTRLSTIAGVDIVVDVESFSTTFGIPKKCIELAWKRIDLSPTIQLLSDRDQTMGSGQDLAILIESGELKLKITRQDLAIDPRMRENVVQYSSTYPAAQMVSIPVFDLTEAKALIDLVGQGQSFTVQPAVSERSTLPATAHGMLMPGEVEQRTLHL